jgi:hypothetical protein
LIAGCRGAGFDVLAQGRVDISPLDEKPLGREGEAALSPARIPARRSRTNAAGMRRHVHDLTFAFRISVVAAMPSFVPVFGDHWP